MKGKRGKLNIQWGRGILNRLKGMLTIKEKQSSYYSWRDNDERDDDPVGFHPTNKILKKG